MEKEKSKRWSRRRGGKIRKQRRRIRKDNI